MDQPFQPYGTMQQSQASAQGQPQEKIGKFKASRMIVSASWEMLKQDKEMMLFPLLSFFASLVAAIIFSLAWLFMFAGGSVETLHEMTDDTGARSMVDAAQFAFLFIFYLVTFFITTYFEAGVVAIAHARIEGGDLTFRDGMRVASAHAGKLFVWSALNATVGIILRTIAERSRLLGQLVASLLGAVWSILTFFTLPVLILEGKGVRESLARSVEAIKKTWGETVIVNVGAGLFMFALMLLGFAALLAALFTGVSSIIVLASITFVVYAFALTLVANTLGVIFKVVLYEYATSGKLPEAFPEQLVRYAFAPKK